MNYTYNNAQYHPSGIATASIEIATAYNKDPDADFIETSHENMDAISEYFKDHAVYKYNADLTMVGKPVKASKISDSVKQMLNSIYGANKFYKEATGV